MIELLRLGGRLSRSGPRRVVLLRSLTILAAFVATMLVLVVAATPHIVEGRRDRAAAAIAVPADSGDPAEWLLRGRLLYLSDGPVPLYELAPLTSTAQPPPGVPDRPVIGHVYAAPALLRNDTVVTALAALGPVSPLDDDALEDPGARLVYVLRSPAELKQAGATPIAHYGGPISAIKGIAWYRSLAMLLYVAVPLMSIVWVAARLRSQQRDAQLRALRLLGVSRRRTALVAAVDTMVVAATGGVIATIVAIALKPHITRVAINGSRLSPHEIDLARPMIIAVIATLVTFGGVAGGAAWRSLDLTRSTRRLAQRAPSPFWAAIAGAAVLAALLIGATSTNTTSQTRRLLLQWSVPLLGIAIVGALPQLVRYTAAIPSTAFRQVSTRIAQQRLRYDPESACRPSRLVAAACFAVIVTSVVLTSFWVDRSWSNQYARTDGLSLLRFTRDSRTMNIRPDLGDYPAIPLYESPDGNRAIVATCADFEAVLGAQVAGCTDAIHHLEIAGAGPVPSDSPIPGAQPLTIPAVDDSDFEGAFLIAPSAPEASGYLQSGPSNWYAAVPTSNVDRVILQDLATVPGSQVSPSSLSLLKYAPDPGGRWIQAGSLTALALGILGFAISAMEAATATSRRTRHLVVLGAPRHVTRRVQVVELLWPLGVSSFAGVTGALVVSWAYTRVNQIGHVDLGRVVPILAFALFAATASIAAAISASGQHRFEGSLDARTD